jgi:SAM-dependent methyltransferase
MSGTRLIDQTVVLAWDAVAVAYQARYAISTDQVHLGPMVPSCAELGIELDIANSRVLDFGCGGGQNAIACALGGASYVVGLDPSERQLDYARTRAEQAGASVDFWLLDDSAVTRLPDDFDVVLAVYSLQFVADIHAAMAVLSDSLRPGGRLIVSVDHPVRLSGEWQDDSFMVEDYFSTGWQSWPYDFPEAGLEVVMRRYRRPMQDWVNALVAGPLVLRGLYEPRPSSVLDSFAKRSKYGTNDSRNVFSPERLSRVPGSLILVADRLP